MWLLWILIGVPSGIIIIICLCLYIKFSLEKPYEDNLGSIPKRKNSMLGSSSKSKNDEGLI